MIISSAFTLSLTTLFLSGCSQNEIESIKKEDSNIKENDTEWKQLFNFIDSNDNNRIETEEVKSVYKNINRGTDEEVNCDIQIMDTDKSGNIDLSEFSDIMNSKKDNEEFKKNKI